MKVHQVLGGLALCGALAGCSMARLRSEASLALQCGRDEIRFEEKQPGTYAAYGCGKMAVCMVPEKTEPQCFGGAEEKPASQ